MFIENVPDDGTDADVVGLLAKSPPAVVQFVTPSYFFHVTALLLYALDNGNAFTVTDPVSDTTGILKTALVTWASTGIVPSLIAPQCTTARCVLPPECPTPRLAV
jgi:hypothetical protein